MSRHKLTALFLNSFFYIFTLSAFIDIETRTLLNAKITFEAVILIIFFACLCATSLKKNLTIVLIPVFIYLNVAIIQFICDIRDIKISDFLLIYKPYIYIFILTLTINRIELKYEFSRKLFRFLLMAFFVKYALMRILNLAYQNRPDLFAENNFELLLLLILFVGVVDKTREKIMIEFLILFAIIGMSGSMSISICFAAIIMVLKFPHDRILNNSKLAFFIVANCMILFIIINRGVSLESIDRVKFLLLFLQETKNWGIFEWLFGSPFLTPVSHITAKTLFYYDTLFSDPDKLLAYSVLFHSFHLRILFDHGLFGLMFILLSVYHLLSVNKCSGQLKMCILIILILSGLSVSAFNSVFAIVGIVIVMGINKRGSSKNYGRN